MGNRFRAFVWDPVLICCQIVTVISLFYFTHGLVLIITSLLLGMDLTIKSVFDSKVLNFQDVQGVAMIVCHLINSLFVAASLCAVINRTKLCLDFTTTTYGAHVVFCWLYSGSFPLAFTWWIFIIVCSTMTCVTAEFFCLRYEMKDIPLLGARQSV